MWPPRWLTGEKREHAIQNIKNAPSDETYKENLSSLVSTVTEDLPSDQIGPVEPFKVLRRGDAVVQTIFSDEPWDGTPIQPDAMKAAHKYFHAGFCNFNRNDSSRQLS